MKDAKFIIVKDKVTADSMISAGFHIVSNANGVYTFMNTIPQHFKFENIDVKKLVYTSALFF